MILVLRLWGFGVVFGVWVEGFLGVVVCGVSSVLFLVLGLGFLGRWVRLGRVLGLEEVRLGGVLRRVFIFGFGFLCRGL